HRHYAYGRVVRIMKIDYLTLFPQMFEGVLNHLILKRAQDKEMLQVNTVDFRNFAENKHNQVDDYTFGGGQGMVLKPEPIFNAMKDIDKTENTRVILMCHKVDHLIKKLHRKSVIPSI